MPENLNVQERVQGTGTWNLPGPINLFSFATYRDAQGRVFHMPVNVAGDQITGQIERVPPPEARPPQA